MIRVRSMMCVAMALLVVAACGEYAAAADALKIAVGQCGNWDSSPVQLGDGAGIYAKHGIAVEAVCTQGTGETQQAVISGSADIGIGSARLARLAPIPRRADPHHLGQRDRQRRLLVRQGRFPAQDHQGRDRRDHHRLFEQRRVDPQRGARPHPRAWLKGKPVATGGPAATLTVALSGQVDIGWTSPPLGFDMLDDGRIRIFARANDVPSLKDQTIRVNIANANSLKAKRDVFVRFVKAFGETIDWTYSADPRSYAAFRKTTLRNATRLRDEFFAKSPLDPGTVKGMDGLMAEAVNLKFMTRVLTPEELAEFVQVPLK